MRRCLQRLPCFYSDQYDLGLEYVRHGEASDDIAIRGDAERRELIASWNVDGRATAAMDDVWIVVDDLREIVASEHPVDLRELRSWTCRWPRSPPGDPWARGGTSAAT